ncbi:MAG: DUF502 domain-containing protein [Nitrospirae bacterium]|nr:DUF502 domain-containing protein [Nitrospirota bacterium]
MSKQVRNLLKKWFITGLLVITPIWATYLILRTLFRTLEGFLGDLLQKYFQLYYIPGLGIISLFIIILLAGIFATNLIGRQLIKTWEELLRRVPIVNSIYTSIKAVVDALSMHSKGDFKKVVLIEFPRKGQYSIAFITGVTKGEIQRLTNERVINVYVPTTPNPTSGFFLFVPESDIIPLSMSVEDGMKMIISGGFYTPNSYETDNITETGEQKEIKEKVS